MNQERFDKLTIRGKLGEINRRKRYRKKHGKEKSRNRRHRATVRRILKFGQDLVDAYKESFSQHLEGHPKQRMALLRRSLLKKRLGVEKLSQSTYNRVLNLNTIAGNELLHVGWNCMSCNISHSHPNFFEIDHIIQVSAGGSSEVENLQNLCPNCHKKKTLELDGFTKHQSFRPAPQVISDSEKNTGDIERAPVS